MQRDCNGQSVYLVGVWCGGLGGGSLPYKKIPNIDCGITYSWDIFFLAFCEKIMVL